jgi:hypothetical protein
MSDVNFLNALITTLRTDTGAGSLVGLTGAATRITRTPIPSEIVIPYVGIRILNSVDLIREVTGWKRYTVKITGADIKERNAMSLGDRVMYLFDDSDVGATASSFYDFTDGSCTVRSTRWDRRVPRRQQVNENVTYWEDSNIITIVANPYLGC